MARPLKAVPDRRLRAIGIIRVSALMGREGDDFTSPETQRTAISDKAARSGYEIVDWVEGIDESGSKAKSTWWRKLDETVARIEDGEAEVALVWKFSRAARHRLRWAVALDRVETAGGVLESATEDFDTTTSAGRFARGMVAEMNAFEAERIGEGWKEAHAGRVRSGRPHTGKPKWGYVYDREAKVHRPDPVTGPVLAELYRRFVAGESFYALVQWLNGHGHRTTLGGTWTLDSLRTVLDAGFGSGRFMAGGDPKRGVKATLHQGVHEPVIDEATWQAYLDARAGRRGTPPRTTRSRFVLAGLVRCGECGGPMSAGTYNGLLRYRCQTRYARGLSLCSVTYLHVEFVEGEVVRWLERVAGKVDELASAVEVSRARRVSHAAEAERMTREAARVAQALSRLAVQNAQTPLPEAVYVQSVAELSAQLAALEEAAEEARRAARGTVGDPSEVARGLLENWLDDPVAHRRDLLRKIVDRVMVYRDGEAGYRVKVVPKWDVDDVV